MKTTESNAIAANALAQQVFHPEFMEFTHQLHLISNWFSDYQEKLERKDDEQVLKTLSSIEGCLASIAYDISDLVAVEFQENVYYKNLTM